MMEPGGASRALVCLGLAWPQRPPARETRAWDRSRCLPGRCCRLVGARIERASALDASGHPMRFALPWWVWNLVGTQGVFLLRRE